MKGFLSAFCVLTLLLSALPVNAVVIDFTGGTVTRLDGTTATTNNNANYDNVDFYEENGFKMDFLPNSGGTAALQLTWVITIPQVMT